MTNEERAQKIRDIMKKGRITSVELAELSGVHENTIGKVLSGKVGVQTGTLQKIAEGLKVSPKNLI